jgi:uncharacterized phage protein (TIGR01671 family)
MREILFRGKRCDNGEWAQGYYIRAEHHWHKHGIHKDWITLGASANGGWFALHNKYAVKAETVGQFTGLTDKNGKKVFEGDIVVFRTRTSTFKPLYVRWYAETAQFLVTTNDCVRSYPMDRSWEYEVIGNIHDNPELLENP